MKTFTEKQAEDFLEKEGFKIAKRKLVNKYEDAESFARKIGYPVVLKASSENLLHKTEANAVRMNVNENNIKENFAQLKKIKNIGIIVQKQIEGQHLLLGIKKDSAFHHVIALGAGGIFTEVIKDVSFRIPPLNKSHAEEMLSELKISRILQGYRNQKFRTGEVIDAILSLSRLSKNYPNIQELDINPMIVNDKEAVIVDARIIFG